jgi:hypothetical protein
VTGGNSASDTSTILDDGTGQTYDAKGANPTGPGNDDTPVPDDTFVPLPPPDTRVPGTPYEWEVIPLGPPPAFVTGVEIASQQGTQEGFATTPSPQFFGTGLGTAREFGVRDSLGTNRDIFRIAGVEPSWPRMSSLFEIGLEERERGVGLHVVREPGQAQVRNAEQTILGLPRGIFRHTDPNAQVAVLATQADGSPLPEWLRINLTTGRVVVQPPPDFVGVVEVRLAARDAAGNRAETTFTITVGEGEVAESPTPQAPADQRSSIDTPADIAVLFFGAANRPVAVATADIDEGRAPSGRMSLTDMLTIAVAERAHAEAIVLSASATR